MLVRGEVQAVVFDAATLQYWAARQGKGLVQVVGPIFRPQKYAIAVPVGSALRKQINRALLEIYTDGTYERIYSAWFSVAQ
jgi:ABC-type amino acid transport substrate-binding protein